MSKHSTSGGSSSRVERLKKLIWAVVIILLVAPTVITCMVGIRFNSLRASVEEMANESPVALSLKNKTTIDVLSQTLSDLSAAMAETNVKIDVVESNMANDDTALKVDELESRLKILEEEYAKLLEKFEALSTEIEETGASSLNYDDDIKAINQKLEALSAGKVDISYLGSGTGDRVPIPNTGR